MDISSRKDIELLMEKFYDKVKKDNTIGPVFTDVAKVNWAHHIPIICDFWETLLLDAASYRKNVMEVHFNLNRKTPLKERHFQVWLKLFLETVDEYFAGEKAELAKKKAQSIAALMQIKIKGGHGGLPISRGT
ncbi:MAG TPA: group III truncated hemoglobin [Chitinophagaceae bacterium]|nr:group III truncated hemoglobin [Chitinophagaceae bacterium]